MHYLLTGYPQVYSQAKCLPCNDFIGLSTENRVHYNYKGALFNVIV